MVNLNHNKYLIITLSVSVALHALLAAAVGMHRIPLNNYLNNKLPQPAVPVPSLWFIAPAPAIRLAADLVLASPKAIPSAKAPVATVAPSVQKALPSAVLPPRGRTNVADDVIGVAAAPSPANIATADDGLTSSVSVAQPDHHHAGPPMAEVSVQSARPDYAYNPPPIYPMMARAKGVGGTVWLQVWVDSEGWAGEIRVTQSSGVKLLDESALDAVRHWRFIPARRGEQALASWVKFPVRFMLEG